MITPDFTRAQKKYPGKWVAFSSDQKTVVASGSKAKSTFEKAKKAGFKKPILFKVPSENPLFVGGGC